MLDSKQITTAELLGDLHRSHERFPLATKGDAMRLMAIWHDPCIIQKQRDEWDSITGTPDITTKVLWDYIRAALVNG
jgi:hypothetical protein